MSRYHIDVQIDPEYEAHVSAEWVKQVVDAALAQQDQPAGAGVSIVIAGDEMLHELNQAYRNLDEPTDVLSFPAHEGEFVGPQSELMQYLGDVVISYPKAVAQASEQGHGVEAELSLLIVHGCLHLLGYDHAEEEERAQMWAQQESILRGLS
jgi:probable rRNA maturation factor